MPIWPARGSTFLTMIEQRREAGDPVPEWRPGVPDGYISTFKAEVDAPRAPLQPGWYLDAATLDAPIYVWVHALDELADNYPDEIETYAQGIACCSAHSIWTRPSGDVAHASAARIASWTPIVAPDPSIVAPDCHAPEAPVYRTPDLGPLPDDLPRTIAVIDIDYASVGGQRLPEKWSIDVIGVLIVERDEVEPSQWKQIAFRSFTNDDIGDLADIAGEVDLILGHNLFDGDYRCLRTYADRLDLGAIVAKTVDTLYAARQIISGGKREPAGLDLTSIAKAHGLRARMKTTSRTDAHRGIKTFHDAEKQWSFQPVSDDCDSRWNVG